MTQGSARQAAAEALRRDGFVCLHRAAETARWAAAARRAALPRVADPAARAAWLRCGQTWFAGGDLLPNGADGAVGGVPLAGPRPALLAALGRAPAAWHAAQVSVVYPGYPRPREGESEGAARYRMRRDAAHVDGLLPEGPGRRRHLREPHAFVLGLPLSQAPAEAAPLVAWAGSHRLMAQAFHTAFAGEPAAGWGEIDATEPYRAARREAFARCPRVPLPAGAGEAVLLHPLTLHGIAPWAAGVAGPPEGRMIAYFRPLLADPADWLADWP